MKPSIQSDLEQRLKRRLSHLPYYVDDYIYSLKDSKELRSRLEYAKDITLFFDFLNHIGRLSGIENYQEIPITILDQLTVRDISEFLDYLTHYEKTFQTTTGQWITQTFTNNQKGKSRKLATLRQWFKYLQREKLIHQNVAQDVDFQVKDRHTIKQILSPQEVHLLLDLIQHQKLDQKKYATHLQERNYMMFCLLAYTGIRISELIQLDISDLRLKDKTMVVTRKGGHREVVILSTQITELLTEYVAYRQTLSTKQSIDQGALFLSTQQKRISGDAVRQMLLKYGEAAELSHPLTPHVLRRTFGTNHYKLNKDMFLTASLLGHASVETTRRHYVQIDDTRKRESVEQFTY